MIDLNKLLNSGLKVKPQTIHKTLTIEIQMYCSCKLMLTLSDLLSEAASLRSSSLPLDEPPELASVAPTGASSD